MDNFRPDTFGKLNATDYDAQHDPGTTDSTVALIAGLVPTGGAVLELAIGTGRVALPLSQMGFAVSGIEASAEMVAKMRAKPGGDAIPTVIGDMAEVDIEGRFDHIFLVFNTLFNLPSQEAQIRCFENVFKHLKPGGTFLIEAFVPNFTGFTENQRVKTKQLELDRLCIEAVTNDPVAQVLAFQRVHITADGMKLVPLPMRYAYPAEIDLMARLAGLRRKHRWGGWDKQDFDADSTFHVSVYEKPFS
ncbi:class I SAM-dependent methyltransferase [Loktanella sp. D2R18]|uniref:class I SAM-dependent methyltransferase n=1 Tax=Rhodobacterales TaxID=204455 RepID=UPI000DE884B9|nr:MULTISPECIES: class I SAM-dependent methyltransferase [Rhodobacterales]MDO6591434.1 class I SAM-dependent methyltransferase [Yoonia sp. 1_MG-2023]RBW43500.1 class I SAM-dependent methyltransferase [Loktanella sp. D2R18]